MMYGPLHAAVMASDASLATGLLPKVSRYASPDITFVVVHNASLNGTFTTVSSVLATA